ncbi:thiamine-phosphate kinase [Alkalihalobacillus trypoxylicola]|uniref:Thiamine-monophosphate kinase n=1 Tax=Alkalihalobacillus trypoxylicola TaxID=519424 RepID=A0A162EJC6_9BACI|nr:thiamine-phosphate kinase [Alkalihalobacillus trypoxylicola]KYG33047.1 thiamine monophosphate kinase [Alkalihalobacillus trypoxylicola]
MKDEFEFIDKITPKIKRQANLIVGIGDDAAIYSPTVLKNQVVCVDTMVEGIHFRKNTLTSYQIGRKALAINISDLAAMGATPKFFLVSIAISDKWNEQELEQIYAGMNDLADKYDMDLIGGDTVSSNESLVISVTAIGEVYSDTQLLRSHAQHGDVVFLTGEVGHSAAGLHVLNEKGINGPFTKDEQVWVLAHQEPEPQIKAGQILANLGERFALNDISDGLASEANELAEASQVSILLDESQIPLDSLKIAVDKTQALKWALFGGEDFQLIGSCSEQVFKKVQPLFQNENIHVTRIGTVQDGPVGVELTSDSKREKLEKRGYNHFFK